MLRQQRPAGQSGETHERHQGPGADRRERTVCQTEPDYEENADREGAQRHRVRKEAARAEAEEDDEQRRSAQQRAGRDRAQHGPRRRVNTPDPEGQRSGPNQDRHEHHRAERARRAEQAVRQESGGQHQR